MHPMVRYKKRLLSWVSVGEGGSNILFLHLALMFILSACLSKVIIVSGM